MLKKYTITQNGLSNGNEIHSPFEIMVTQMIYNSNTSKLVLAVCTCNNEGVPCDNDDIANILNYDLPSLSSTKSTDLKNSIEVLLEETYPGNWS